MDITLSEPRHRLWDAVTAELQAGGWAALSGLSLTLLQLAHKNLLALRQSLADPQQPRVDWTNPWIEAQYPVEWDWERHFPLLSEPPARQRFRNQYLAEWARELAQNPELRVFHYLTRGVAVLVRGDSYRPLVPKEPREELRNLSEGPRREALERLLREPLYRDNSQRLAIEMGGRLHEVTVVLEFHPLVLDEGRRRAYYPVVTGLDLGDLAAGAPDWSAAQQASFWEQVLSGAEEAIGILVSPPRDPWLLQKAQVEVPDVLPEPRVSPLRTFPLPMGPGLIDREVHELISTATRTRGLFQRWSDLPLLEEAVREEARRILAEGGEEALRRRKGGLRAGPTGEPEPYLASDSRAVKDLMIRLGLSTGYRRQETEPRTVLATGGVREYACRVFETSRGFVEIGLSWSSLAGPWVDEWHEDLARRVEARSRQIAELQAQAADSLFPEVQQQEIARLQEMVDNATQAITIWKRGHVLMGLIQSQVYHQRSNWVRLPAEAIRMALWEVEGRRVPDNWKQDVDNVLASLATITFTVRGLDGESVKGFGHFLGEVWYEDRPILVARGDAQDPPRPPEGVPSGTYLLSVQPGFLGCLQTFQRGETHLDGPAQKLLFDWTKKLSPQERKQLGSGGEAPTGGLYLAFDPARFLAHGARNLTASQRALDDCLERELTLNWQRVPGRRKRLLANAQGGREALYTHEDCPLLPPGQSYVVAGGNGSRPGQGYTVGGSTRVSTQRGGWLAKVGYPLRPGHGGAAAAVRAFLGDLRTVVMEYYGGVVVGLYRGRLLTLEQVGKLRPSEAMKAIIRPYLPADYQQRRRQIIRDRGIALHDTAEEVEQAAAAERGPTGEDLRLARRQRRLTQTEMARLLGVSQSMVSQIETGQRPIPDDLRQIIADWLAGE